MNIQTTRFGDISIDDAKIITFAEGIPGLEDYKRYALLSTEETEPFHWLQCLEDPGLALSVIHPHTVFPDYAPMVPEVYLEELGVTRTEDVLLLTVCVVPADYRRMTTNLISPILVNTANNQAKQIILENSAYELRKPIFEALRALTIKGDAAHAGTDPQA